MFAIPASACIYWFINVVINLYQTPFLQKSLLGLLEKMKQGCITEEDIRADLQTRFPDWNIQTGTLSEEEEVINGSICT